MRLIGLIGLFGLRSDGTPDPIRIFRYTPGYINKWYMAEYRKTIPDAADNMVELEMALDQAADLFKEADTEGRGTSTASLCVSRFLSRARRRLVFSAIRQRLATVFSVSVTRGSHPPMRARARTLCLSRRLLQLGSRGSVSRGADCRRLMIAAFGRNIPTGPFVQTFQTAICRRADV